MMNLLINGANMIIKPKRKRQQNQGQQGGQYYGGQNQGGWGGQQNQGWGGQGQGQWGNQGGMGYQQQGGWGGQNQGGWGQNQGGWGGQYQGGNQYQGQTQNQGWEKQNQDGWGLGFISDQAKKFWGNNFGGQQWVQQQKKRNDFNIVNPQQQPTVNLQKVIGEQIVFIEPSPAQKKIEQLRRQGRPFIDESFPANQASLVGEYGPQSEWKGITWRKVTQTMQNPVLFHEKPNPGDIKQGYLGDCYFLAGLAAIAERPDRIFNLFLTSDLNQQRYFSVKMLYKGKWMTVDMDEFIPWSGNQPAFSRANKDDLWVILLQKAWAKLYTSYKRIEAGYPEQTLHDLTGAPIRQILLKNASFNKQQQWAYLLQASKKQYAMVASSLPGSDRNKSMSGVVQGHAYTVLNATTINFNGSQQRIIQLRNPWGKGEFTGKWSDSDPNWNSISPQERQRVGFKPDKTDGLFYMPYDNFCAEFRSITVAEVDDNASYIYKSTKDKQCKGVYFAIDILKEDIYSFQVDKTPERIYPEKYQQIFQYPEALIEVGRIQGNQCQKFQGLRSARRTLFKKQRLTPGRYVAFVKIAYNVDFEDQYDVNLAIYSGTACNITLASRQEAAIFSGNPNVNWTGQDAPSKQPWNSQGNVQSMGNNNFVEGNNQQQGQSISFGQQQYDGQQINFGGSGGSQGWGGQQQGGQQQGGQQQGGQQGGGWEGQGHDGWGGWGGQGAQGGW